MFQAGILRLLMSFCILSSHALHPFARLQDGAEQSLKKKSVPRARRSIFSNPITLGVCNDEWPSPLRKAIRDDINDILGALGRGLSGDETDVAVLYARNLVQNRALFFSIALQLQNGTQQFGGQPGFLYYYASAATAVFTAPSVVMSSGLFYDTNKHYPNWLRRVDFNETIPLFAPRAIRQSSPELGLRVDDYGADITKDYTSPDNSNATPQTEEHYAGRQNKQGGVSTAGFALASSAVTPTVSDPYYDCTRGLWLVTLTSPPVVDVLPRYTGYRFLRKPSYVAVATVDLDVGQLLSGLEPEVTSFHNMLVPMLDCPDTTGPAPATGPLSPGFFRSLYPQSRLAAHLAHTLSAFLQNRAAVALFEGYANPQDVIFTQETPSSKIKVDAPLSDTLLEAEVLANVLTDPAILASGVFFDVQQFTSSDGTQTSTPARAFQAWRSADGTMVADLSTSPNPNSLLMNKAIVDWDNLSGSLDLSTYLFHIGIRSSKDGGGLTCYQGGPLQYRAAAFGKGYWTSPHFKCDGFVDDWVVTYAAPFFGSSDADPSNLVFRGIVTVDIAVTADNWNV